MTRRHLRSIRFALAVAAFLAGLVLVCIPHLFAHAGTVGAVLAVIGTLSIIASGWLVYMRSMGDYRRSW